MWFVYAWLETQYYMMYDVTVYVMYIVKHTIYPTNDRSGIWHWAHSRKNQTPRHRYVPSDSSSSSPSAFSLARRTASSMAAGEKNPANDGLRWSRLALLGPMEQNSHIEGLAVGWWLRSRELDWVWRGVCDGRWSMVTVKCEWWWWWWLNL